MNKERKFPNFLDSLIVVCDQADDRSWSPWRIQELVGYLRQKRRKDPKLSTQERLK